MTGAAALPPAWSLARPKPAWQWLYDFVAAPLRMMALPDRAAEGLHLTSLRAERFARVLERIEGRCIDIGAGDNALVRLYRARAPGAASAASVGVDVVDWGGDALVVPDSARLPFAAASFDTACFVACLNHIPARGAALAEAFRVLRPGGVLTISDVPVLRFPTSPREVLAGVAMLRLWGIRAHAAATPFEIEHLVEAAGFDDIRSSLEGERVIGPAFRSVHVRLAGSSAGGVPERLAARTMLREAEVLWRHGILEYLFLVARKP